MNWFWYVMAGNVLAAVASIVQRKQLSSAGKRKFDPYAFTILYQSVGALCILLFALLTTGYALPDFGKLWPFILINVVLSGASDVFAYNALRRLQASRFVIISSFSPVATVIMTFVVMGIILRPAQLVGGALIIAGILIVYFQPDMLNKRYKKGVRYGLASAAAGGMSFVNDKHIYESAGVLSFLPVSKLISATALFAIRPRSRHAIRHIIQPSNVVVFLIGTVLLTSSTVFYMYGIQAAANPAAVGILQQLRLILVVILGITVLKERDHIAQKAIAGVLCIFGVALIILVQ